MIKMELIHGSCADQKADIVVNAANRHLAAGGGICGVIFNKAGYDELTEACRKQKTPLKDGDAVITPAFDLSDFKAIVHAVGPNFGATPEAFDELVDAYYNSMILMKENGYHSISFPLISSGIFGGSLKNPARESARRCCEAARVFTAKYPEYDADILLCAFSSDEYDKALEFFGGVAVTELCPADGNYVGELLKDKKNEEGASYRVIKENGNNVIVKVRDE